MPSLQRRMTVFANRLPLTETVALNAITAMTGGSAFGGGGGDTAGVAIALRDGSDSTGYGLTTTSSITLDLDGISFAPLTKAAGRGIASLVVRFRGSNSGVASLTPALVWTGITPSSTTWSSSSVAGSTITTYTSAVKTKSGGGTWTADEINAFTLDFAVGPSSSGSSHTVRLYQMEIVVTYA